MFDLQNYVKPECDVVQSRAWNGARDVSSGVLESWKFVVVTFWTG